MNDEGSGVRRRVDLSDMREGVIAFRWSLMSFFHGLAKGACGDKPSFFRFREQVFDCEFEERDGLTPQTAIVIHGTADEHVGVSAEYLWGNEGHNTFYVIGSASRGRRQPTACSLQPTAFRPEPVSDTSHIFC